MGRIGELILCILFILLAVFRLFFLCVLGASVVADPAAGHLAISLGIVIQ